VDDALESTFANCERELAAGRTPDLRALGFWRAVARVKRDQGLIYRYAERVARIDRETFRRRTRLRTGADVGAVLLWLGTAIGLLVLGAAAAQGHPLRELGVLIGMGALLATTHDLAHLLAGAVTRIHFTEWYVDLPRKPQPGLKTDYASYLRASPRQRAWMHASGAIVSKIVPFAVVPYALAIGCDVWAVAVLLAVGIVSIVTDVLFSVRASDWKRFRREMRLATPSRASRTTP